LLGPIGLILGWTTVEGAQAPGVLQWVGMALVCFVIPAVLCPILAALMKKIGWIKDGDMKLEL
ncbi:MAG: PTS sugar transporter subunit IIC, partial [Clostridia bacterium]|nr:PTS sugar transporter subunit IIC [Clostridia bacterium]